ncbi:MAG: DUF2167 domain-containing protein [Nitratireductor sp.]|nr:DUF2167 domain-containing protein [Nitratireductor sp.]
MKKLVAVWVAALTILAAAAATAFAQKNADFFSDYDAYNEEWKGFLDELSPQRGEIKLDHGIVLNVPQSFYYLNPADSRKVLEKAWENPPSAPPLGMLFPSRSSPLEDTAWGIEITFEDIGYVNDEDANSYDYDELLATMQEDTRAANAERQQQGYPPVELVGWAQPPEYDQRNRQLLWAKDLVFGNADHHTLNYNVRVLGRKGVLQFNYIAAIADLAEINGSIDEVGSLVSYAEGHRYADFVPGVDTVAAVGIGGLIAGKVLAKTGLLAAALLLLKKFWFILFLPFVWLGKLFRRNKGGGEA